MQNHTQNNHGKTTPSPVIQSPQSASASTNPQNGNNTCPQQLPANPDNPQRENNMANVSAAPTNNKQQQNCSTQEPNVQANIQTISNSSRQAKSTPPNLTTNIPSPKSNSGSAKQIPNAEGKPPPYNGQKQDKKPFKGVSNPISIITEKPKPTNQLIARVAPSMPYSSSVSYAMVCARNLPGVYQANQATQRVAQSPIFNLNHHAQVVPPAQVAHSRSRTESQRAVPVETIRENLSNIMKRHSGGIPIFKLQKVYLFKFGKPLSPNGYSSLRHFLVGMRDVVQIKGVGVQTLVSPAPSEKISSAVKEQHDSNLLHKNKSLHNEKMLSPSGPMSLHRQGACIAKEPQKTAVEQAVALIVTVNDPHLLSTVSPVDKKREQKCPKEEGNHNIKKKSLITQGQYIVTEFRDQHLQEKSVPSELLNNSSLDNPSVVHRAMENRTSTEVASVESSNHGITQQLNPECPAASCNNIPKQLTENSDQLFHLYKAEPAPPLSLPKEQLHDEPPFSQSHQNDLEPFVNDLFMLKEAPLFQTPELFEPQGSQNVSQKIMQIKYDFPFFKDQQHKLILHSSGFSVVKQETNHVSMYLETNELPYQSISSSLNIQMGHESQLNSVHDREKDTDTMERKTCVQEVLPSSQSQHKTPNTHESMSEKRDPLTSILQEQVSENMHINFNKQTECKYSSHHKDSDLPEISLPGQATFYPIQSQRQLSGYNTLTMERQIKSSPERNHNVDYSNTDNSEKQHFNFPIKKDLNKDNVLANKETDGKQSLLSQIHQTPCTQSLDKRVNDPRNIKANGDNISPSLPANIVKNHWSSESPNLKTHQINHATFNNKFTGEEESPTLETEQMETNLSIKKKPRRRSRALQKVDELPADAPESSRYPTPYNGPIACKIDKPDKTQDNFMTSCTKNLTAWSIVCSKKKQQVRKLNGNNIERVIESHTVQKKSAISTSVVKKKPRRKRSKAHPKADEVPGDAPQSSSCPPPNNGSIACKIDKPESALSSSDKQHRSPPVFNNNASIMTTEKAKYQFMTSCTKNLTEKTPASSGFAFQKMHMEAKHLNSNILQQTQYTKPLDFGGQNKQVDNPVNKRAPEEKEPSCLAASMNDSNTVKNNGSSETTTLEIHQHYHDICINKIPGGKGSPSSESDQGKKKLSTTDTMAQTVYSCSETNQQVRKLTVDKSQEINRSTVKKKSKKRKSLSSPAFQKTKDNLDNAPQSVHYPASHHNGLISKAESTVSYSKVHQVVSQDSSNHKANTGISALSKTKVLIEQNPSLLAQADPTQKEVSTWQNSKESLCSIL